MNNWAKFAIGLGAALLVGWAAHGPLGGGERLLARLDRDVQAVVAQAGVPGVRGAMQREPVLARTALLTGPADRFQREGQGSFPGIDGRVAEVPGVAAVRWTNPPPS